MVFLKLRREPGVYSRVTVGMANQTCVCVMTSGHLSSYDGYLMNLNCLGRTRWTLLEVWCEMEGNFLVGTVILEFLTIFKKSQAPSTFESLNSAGLSRYQRDASPLGQMSRRHRAFCRISTGDSDIPSHCEMKEEPAFQPLQGNPAFFRVRASRGPFHLKQKTQGPSHIHVPEGKLLLRCLWKVGISLQSKRGNQLSSPDDMGCTEHSSSCFTEIDVPLDLRWVCEGIYGFC